MAAHAYWRVYITANNGDTSYTNIAELELRGTVGGPNLATDGLLASASTFSTGYEAAKAFDANTATWWATTAGAEIPSWLQYSFASPVDIVEHAITGADATRLARDPKQWQLQYSDDGVTWRTLVKIGSQTDWTAAEQRVFTHSAYPLFGDFTGAAKAATVAASTGHVTRASVSYGEAMFSNNNPTWVGKRRFLAGTVMELGVPVRRLVRAYHRKTGDLIGETYSDTTTGAFSLESKGWGDACYVIAFDDLTDTPDYNAKIYDLVTPM